MCLGKVCLRRLHHLLRLIKKSIKDETDTLAPLRFVVILALHEPRINELEKYHEFHPIPAGQNDLLKGFVACDGKL